MPKSKSDVEWRAYRAGNKYKKTDGGKWIIDTSNKLGSVRPIDLMSRDPDRLREFESKEAAVAFEEECYQDAKRLKVAGADWSAYRYIPRKKLTIPEDQRRLHDSLAGEIRVKRKNTRAKEKVIRVIQKRYSNGNSQPCCFIFFTT